MKVKRIVAALAITALMLCGSTLADDVTIVAGNGWVYTFDENDLTITGLVSQYDFGKGIVCAAGDRVTGDIVLGFNDGTTAVVKYDRLGTILTSGAISGGSAIMGAAIRPNGELYFANTDGWAYARDNNDITAAPPGYTPPAALQLISGISPYLSVTTSPQDKVVFIATDRLETWIRQGNDMNSVPPGYVNDHIVWGSYLTAWQTTSTGDVVIASGLTGNAKVFIRDDANMAALPTGYAGSPGDVSGVQVGTDGRIKAMARTADDMLIIGNDHANVYVRLASNLADASLLPGYFSNEVTGQFIWGPSALAVTSNNNVIIGCHEGRVFVRSLFDIAGDDITPPSDFTAGDVGIVGIFPMPYTGGEPTCEQKISMGNVLTGDFNRDCYVDFKDIAIFALDWTKCNDPENEDCMW